MVILSLALAAAGAFPFSEPSLQSAFGDHQGALVVMDCTSGQTVRLNPKHCAERRPPCSTFKIWNTAIGLELGILTTPDQPFYKWDGKKRAIEPWNHDLTLRQAFAVSCVPAFQELARSIGTERMDTWVRKLGYGDSDTSAGNDAFWLPAPGKKSLMISPDEQVQLLRRLLLGQAHLSADTTAKLKEIMTVKKTELSTLSGKTGTGSYGKSQGHTAWFVGFVETSGKSTYIFACLLEGPVLMGKDARTVVETLLQEQGAL